MVFRPRGLLQTACGCEKLVIFAVVCLAMLSPAWVVHATQEVSLSEVYRLAVENDPTLSGVEHLRESVKEKLSLAWGQLLPTVNATAQFNDTTQDIISSENVVYDAGKSDFTTTEYGISLRQPLLRYDLFLGVGQAKVEQQKADLELKAAQQDLVVRVTERYLVALSAQDQLEFAKAEETAVRQHFELANARFEMGLAPITDLHDAKARLASREARTFEAEIQRVDAFEALRELTGIVPEGIMPLTSTFKPSPPVPDNAEQWVETATRENLTVQAQGRLVNIAKREVSIQKSGHYPILDLVASFDNQDTQGTLFGGGSEVQTLEYGIQFSLPIYQGSTILAKTRQAYAQQQKIESDLERVRRETVRQARSSFLGVKNSISRIEALEQALISQQSTLEAKQQGYRAGLFTSLAVLDAERDLYQAKNELAQARYDYIFSNLKLRQAVGSLSRADLDQANQWFTAQ